MTRGFWDRSWSAFLDSYGRRPLIVEAWRFAWQLTIWLAVFDLVCGRNRLFSDVLLSFAVSFPVTLALFAIFRAYAWRRVGRIGS